MSSKTISFGNTRCLTLALLSANLLSACAPSPGVRPSVESPLLRGLGQAARWDKPSKSTLVALASAYMNEGRDAEGLAFFRERRRERSDEALFLAFEGLFQARTAKEVRLLQRVAWVEGALHKLDRAARMDPYLSRYLRALVLARLPKRFGTARIEEGVRELRDLLESKTSFLFAATLAETTRESLLRQGYQAIAQASETLARPLEAAKAWRNAGGPARSLGAPLLGTAYSVSERSGFRFCRPHFWHPHPKVHVARGYDFGDIAFVETSAGVVVIDSGTTPENARAALRDFRDKVTKASIHTVVLTHAHWDHIGGLSALLEERTRVVAQANFADELRRVNDAGLDYSWFFGSTLRQRPDTPLFRVRPDTLIAETEDLQIGDTLFRLHPVSGGETSDALIVELPQASLSFVGDTFMPYFGAPFVSEGDPEGLIEVITLLRKLNSKLLIHGHPPLSELYTQANLLPLQRALRETAHEVLRGIKQSQPLWRIEEAQRLPAWMSAYPDAVVPFLVMRPHFIQRLHRQRTGYWQKDLEGLETIPPRVWSKAIDHIAGGRAKAWTSALSRLLEAGDIAVAWRLSEFALIQYPKNRELLNLRLRALHALRKRYQTLDPFKFIVYSELARIENPAIEGP